MSSFRILLFLAPVLLALTASARAGDVSNVEILGFDADGGVFAFEEYGVQDGSGFPYAQRYYIDTANDRFLSGTPIKVVLRDENATLEAARAEAASRGNAIVANDVLAAHPGNRAGWNAITEESADATRMRVNPRPIYPPVDAKLEFRLEEFAMPRPATCSDLGDIMGFRLVRVDTQPGGKTTLVHKDEHIPDSRGCPIGYRLSGVQTFFPDHGAPIYAIMIAIKSFGFEGPAFDWIAVTGRL